MIHCSLVGAGFRFLGPLVCSNKYLLCSCFLLATSSASEARPNRTSSQAPGCNVTMPCDFSLSQSDQRSFSSYLVGQTRPNRRADAQVFAERSVDRGQVVG